MIEPPIAVILAATLALAVATAGLSVADGVRIEHGIASQYAEGVIERVIHNRQAGKTAHDLPDPLPDVSGFIVVRD